MQEQLTQERQQIVCEKCGNLILVPIIKIRHAAKGTGAAYKLANLHNDHDWAMRSLFELGAVDIYHRKPLNVITKKFKDLVGHYPVTNTVGGRISELANVNLQFVGYYSPKKTERTDDNPTWRNNKVAGWFLKQRGIDWCEGKLGYLDGEFQYDQESQVKLGKVLWEDGHKADRETILR